MLIWSISTLGLGRVLHQKCLFFVVLLLSWTNFVHCVFNAEELKSINYQIDILNVPVKAEEVVDFPTLQMTSKFGQQYQCQLPLPFVSDDNNDQGNGEPEIPDMNDLLKPLGLAPCLLKSKDWWTYEFCYGKHIRQYHIEESQIAGPILTLGVFDMSNLNEKSTIEENSKLEQNRYYSQFYVNGSKCDLTGTLRSSEIRFFCEPDSSDYISRVDEPETCHYIVTIHTSHVCAHPHLKPLPSVKPHTIQCNPVLPEEHYAKYLQRIEEEKEKAELKRREWLAGLAEQQAKLEELKVKVQEKQQEAANANKENNEEVKVENDDATTTTLDTNKQDQVEEEEEEEEFFEVTEDLLKGMKELEASSNGLVQEELRLQQNIKLQLEAIKEAQELLEQNVDEENKEAAYLKMAMTLSNLITKKTQAEKDLASALERIKKGKTIMENFKKKFVPETSESTDNKKDKNEKEEEEIQIVQMNQNNEENNEEEDEELSSNDLEKSLKSLSDLDNDGKVRVRIRRVNSDTTKSDDKLQWFRHKGLDAGQKQKLEDAVKEKLEQAGLDTTGRHIEVKIITAGYYDDEDGKDFHVLSDEETQQFQSMILTLLTRNQEARKEMDRQRKLEQNYQFIWSQDSLQLQDANEEE